MTTAEWQEQIDVEEGRVAPSVSAIEARGRLEYVSNAAERILCAINAGDNAQAAYRISAMRIQVAMWLQPHPRNGPWPTPLSAYER